MTAKKPRPAKPAAAKPPAAKPTAPTPSAEAERPLPEVFDTDEEPRGRRQHGAAHPLDPVDDEAEAAGETVDVESGVVGGRGGDSSP